MSNAAEQFRQGFSERDGNKVADLLAENVVAMYPRPTPYIGRQANRQLWVSFFEPADVTHPITVDEVAESEHGDLGYIVGRWWFIQPSTNTRLGGRYFAIWQPFQGSWELTHVSANTFDDISAEEPPA